MAGPSIRLGHRVDRHLKGPRIMPIDDWQFWIVSLLALLALAFVAKPLFPMKSRQARCGGCPSNASDNEGHEKRASLTVGGKRVS